MKTLDDVVAELQNHTHELEKHTGILDELIKVTSEIRTSQTAMANAVTLLVSQLSDRKTLESRLARVEEDVRQLKGTH